MTEHPRFAHLPEYARLERSMNELVEAMRREDADLSEEEWLLTVLDVACELPYSPDLKRRIVFWYSAGPPYRVPLRAYEGVSCALSHGRDE